MKQYEEMSELELLQLITDIEKTEIKPNVKYFSANHNLEFYLFEYYVCKDEYEIVSKPIHKMYEVMAKKEIEKQNYEKGKEYIEKAKAFNPTDIDIMETESILYRKMGDWTELASVVQRMHPFCYTKRDMASFYRLAACYHIETYHPEIARMLLLYSNLFMKNESAVKDLKFLETALKEETPNYSVQDLQSFLDQKGYPLQAKQETLALLYKVALVEKDHGNWNYAKILLEYLYQQTFDEEVKQILEHEKEK